MTKPTSINEIDLEYQSLLLETEEGGSQLLTALELKK